MIKGNEQVRGVVLVNLLLDQFRNKLVKLLETQGDLCYCYYLPFMAINIDNGNHFHESYNDQTDCTGKRVEHLEPILASTCTEDETDNEAEKTHHSSHMLFLNPLYNVDVEQRAKHALEYADLRA